MTDYDNIINDLLGINDTMFAISASNKNIDKISIRMAFDKNWHNIAERAATAIQKLQAEVDEANKSADAYRAMYFAKRGHITIEKVRELDEIDCHFHSALIRLMYKRIEELESEKRNCREDENADKRSNT